MTLHPGGTVSYSGNMEHLRYAGSCPLRTFCVRRTISNSIVDSTGSWCRETNMEEIRSLSSCQYTLTAFCMSWRVFRDSLGQPKKGKCNYPALK